MSNKECRISKYFFTSAVRNSLFDIRYSKSDRANLHKLALMGVSPEEGSEWEKSPERVEQIVPLQKTNKSLSLKARGVFSLAFGCAFYVLIFPMLEHYHGYIQI
jgi:hypothetical protein